MCRKGTPVVRRAEMRVIAVKCCFLGVHISHKYTVDISKPRIKVCKGWQKSFITKNVEVLLSQGKKVSTGIMWCTVTNLP